MLKNLKTNSNLISDSIPKWPFEASLILSLTSKISETQISSTKDYTSLSLLSTNSRQKTLRYMLIPTILEKTTNHTPLIFLNQKDRNSQILSYLGLLELLMLRVHSIPNHSSLNFVRRKQSSTISVTLEQNWMLEKEEIQSICILKQS